jgi:hypothetical protein
MTIKMPLAQFLISGILESMNELLLGTGSGIFTPPAGTLMAGFGHRDHGAEGVLDDLEFRLFLLKHGDGAVCIISADHIGFGAAFTAQLRQDLHEITGINPAKVLLCASHTHCGPQMLGHLPKAGGPLNESVQADLREKIKAAAGQANQSLISVRMSWGESSLSGFAINRRRKTPEGFVNAPNPFGRRDDAVTAIQFNDAKDNTLRAVLFSYTCHPTTLGGYLFSGDYPGAARRALEHKTGAIAGFLPGCFGDVRPNCTVTGNGRFRAGNPTDIEDFGAALANAVMDASKSTFPLTPQLDGVCDEVELPLQAEGDSRALPLQRLDLAKDFSIMAMGGEVCVDYGHFIKGLSNTRRLLPLGYSNDVIAYIPTVQILEEGGYEAESSCPLFGLPSPFQPAIENLLKDAVKKMLA